MNTEIQLTEALTFYVEKGVNINAVQQILEVNTKKGYTVGMSWDEIEAHNQARLAALKVQTDYWSLMNEVWNQTWGTAVAKLLPGTQKVSIDEYDNERSLENVWDDYLYHQYRVNGSLLVMCASFDSNVEHLELRFYMEGEGDQGYESSNNLVLSDIWDAEPENDERKTAAKLVTIRGASAINVASLAQAAHEAIEKLIVQAGVGQLTR